LGFICLSIPDAQTAENAPTAETAENAPTTKTQTTQPPKNEVESQATSSKL